MKLLVWLVSYVWIYKVTTSAYQDWLCSDYVPEFQYFLKFLIPEFCFFFFSLIDTWVTLIARGEKKNVKFVCILWEKNHKFHHWIMRKNIAIFVSQMLENLSNSHEKNREIHQSIVWKVGKFFSRSCEKKAWVSTVSRRKKTAKFVNCSQIKPPTKFANRYQEKIAKLVNRLLEKNYKFISQL